MNVLELEGITKTFGSLAAVENVDFDLKPGEIHAVLGENGAGKSTLMNLIYGLYRPDAGEVRISGKPARLNSPRDAIAHGVGMVHQHFMLVQNLTVAENIALGLPEPGFRFRRDKANQKTRELSERFGFAIDSDAYVWQLSVGLQQRVEILKVLAAEAQILILDEPTAGVDVELRRTLWKFTRELNEAGHTIVLTTHYLEEAEELCDRIAILDRGQLSVLEDKRALLDRHPYRFLSLQLSGNGGALPASVERLIEDRHGDTLELKLEQGKDFIADVMEQIRDAGYRIQDVRTREPSLENIFVELTDHSNDRDEDAA